MRREGGEREEGRRESVDIGIHHPRSIIHMKG